MRPSMTLPVMCSICCLSGCVVEPVVAVPGPAPSVLSRQWMIGIERMADDPGPRLPMTNRMIADLAAMPMAQVVFLGVAKNDFQFSAWQGPKLRVVPWLHGENHCMNISYTLFDQGHQQGLFGLVVAPLPAGVEPDSACVDRAASQFYQALVVQGL
jgi:hypothetical protein